MRKLLIITLAAMFMCMGPFPVFADSIPSNIEYMDELNIVYEIGGSDALWGSKHLDVGIMTGISNLGNPWNDEKVSSYAMVKADVKGIRLFNRLWAWIVKKK